MSSAQSTHLFLQTIYCSAFTHHQWLTVCFPFVPRDESDEAKVKIPMFSGGGYDFPWALPFFPQIFLLDACWRAVSRAVAACVPGWLPNDPHSPVGPLWLVQEQILLAEGNWEPMEPHLSLSLLTMGPQLWHGPLSVRLTISENEFNCARWLWCQAFSSVPSKVSQLESWHYLLSRAYKCILKRHLPRFLEMISTEIGLQNTLEDLVCVKLLDTYRWVFRFIGLCEFSYRNNF